jgi:hypothetical protein
MAERLELPTGETVTPEEPFLYEGYPYRFRPADADEPAMCYLSPLYWGGGQMDVPVPDRGSFEEGWTEASRGVLTDREWATWLENARGDDRFDDAELDALARELGVADAGPGILDRLRRLL